METPFENKATGFISCIPEAERPWVLPALLQDGAIWAALQNPAFAGRAIRSFGQVSERWSPAEICFLHLDLPVPNERTPIEPELRLRCIQAYRELVYLEPGPHGKAAADAHLSEAALLAIAMLENRRKANSWMFLSEDLAVSLSKERSNLSLWGTALAVAYGLAQDRLALLGVLIRPGSSETAFHLALQALLSNARRPSEYEQILFSLCLQVPLEDGVRLLLCLSGLRPSLAERLAEHWLGQRKADSKNGSRNPQATPIKQLEHALLEAELSSLGGQSARARSLLEHAGELLECIRADLAREMVEAALAAEDAGRALESWQGNISRSSAARPPVALIVSLLEIGQTGAAEAVLPTSGQDDPKPLGWLAAAHAAQERGDLPAARDSARRCLNATSEFILSRPPNIPSPEAAHSFKEAGLLLSHLRRFCLFLGLYPEAVQAAKLSISQDPSDAQRCDELASTYRLAGEPDMAVQFAELAVALQPAELGPRRELAASMEAAHNFSAALEVRTSMLEARFAPPDEAIWPAASEWHALADCAIRAGKPEVAIQAAHSALHLNPEDGLALAYLGEAMLASGKVEPALDRLVQATQLAPHQARSWLSLARAYQFLGEQSKSSETLRVAVHAVPDHPEILLALAESYLDENALSQARACLAQAFELLFNPAYSLHPVSSYLAAANRTLEDPSRMDRELACQIGVLYGRILLELGHPEAASQVYETVYQAAPAYPGLAYAFGSALVKTGNLRAALAPFAIAVGAAPKDPSPYIEYASALLAVGEAAQDAIQAIQKCLDAITELEASLADPAEDLPSEEEGLQPDVSVATPTAWPRTALPERWFPRTPWSRATLRSLRREALALLAQAFEASGELEASLKTYSFALEEGAASDLSRDLDMSLGMARVALRLKQPEVAIAALQEAARNETARPTVQRTLAEAYAAIHLPDEALRCARSALQIAPDNIELLTWFADLCSGLGAHPEAVPALSRAMQLDARNSGLAVRLGRVLNQLNMSAETHQAYLQVLNNPQAKADDLVQAARALHALGDLPAAIQSLEGAISAMHVPAPGLLEELAVLYQQSGEIDKALDTLELAIQADQKDASLFYRKAMLLECLERSEAAKASLERASQLSPGDPAIHLCLASILRGQGDLAAALAQAEIALSATQDGALASENLAARGECADLARALVQTEKARDLLGGKTDVNAARFKPEIGWQHSPMSRSLGPQEQLHYFCIVAELALEGNEEIAAAEALTRAIEQDPAALRVQALQSRLAFRRGDFPLALQILQKASEQVETTSSQDPGARAAGADDEDLGYRHCGSRAVGRSAASDLLSVSMAALDLEQWELAFTLLDRAAAISSEPYVLLQQARCYILRAEFQLLCQAVDSRAHAPGPVALDQAAYRSFEEKIRFAIQEVPSELRTESTKTILRWQARGQAVFTSGSEALNPLEGAMEGPEDFAAYLAQLTRVGDLAATNRAQNMIRERYGGIPSHPALLVQMALSKGLKSRRQEDLNDSLSAIRAAIDQRPHQPLYHAVLALLAKAAGNPSLALHAMLTALSFWPDEPRWHALAGSLYLDAGDVPAAISHLNKAIELEPDCLQHHLQLGKAHLEAGESEQAIAALEKAVAVSPHEVDGYMALASAYFLGGDLARAAAASEKAARLDAKNIPPLLLHAEIALRMEAYEQAREIATHILQIKPDHPQALHLLAQALHRLGFSEEALRVVEQAIPQSDNPLPLILDRICILETLDGDINTLEALRELANEYPDDPGVLTQLARSLGEAGENAEAIRAAQRALRNAEHGMHPPDMAVLHQMLGRLLQQAGQLDQAIHQLSEAARLAPAQVPILLDLAAIQFERRQFSRALETYQQAIQLAPQDPRPYYQAGIALKMSRDYPEAEAMLRKAAELAPDDLLIHRQLAALIALNLIHTHRQANITA